MCNSVSTLWRAEAVETTGIICPLRIAEIGRAVGADESVERVGLQWLPHRIEKTRAGFHHDDQVAAAGDGEPKPVCPHAKHGAAALRIRIPQKSRATIKRRMPAGGSSQIINGCIIVTGEHRRIRTSAGGITLETDCFQAGAD